MLSESMHILNLYRCFLIAILKVLTLFKNTHQNVSSMKGKAPGTMPCSLAQSHGSPVLHISNVKDELPVESYVLANTTYTVDP